MLTHFTPSAWDDNEKWVALRWTSTVQVWVMHHRPDFKKKVGRNYGQTDGLSKYYMPSTFQARGWIIILWPRISPFHNHFEHSLWINFFFNREFSFIMQYHQWIPTHHSPYGPLWHGRHSSESVSNNEWVMKAYYRKASWKLRTDSALNTMVWNFI